MRKYICCYRMTFLLGLLGGILLLAQTSAAQEELLPNQKAFPAYDLSIVGSKLRFSTLTWNSGSGPLELIAGLPGNGVQKVYQRIYFTDGSFEDRYAGTFEWHPAHNHFHFGDYALYTLQPVDAHGGSARMGSKTTFCVLDTDHIDPGLAASPAQPVYTTCGEFKQGMSVGYGDEYGSRLAGQELDLTGLPKGDYRLTIEVDPKKRLLEENETDNTACVLLHINPNNGRVDILDDNTCDNTGGGGSDVIVDAIDPNSQKRGTTAEVTIRGSGFSSGTTVRFENGSGAKPVATINSVSDNEIKAMVTVKKGARGNWDVQVDSYVVSNGFTVEP